MVAQMKIRQPDREDRIYVIVKNPQNGKSKTFTIYGATDHQAVAGEIQKLLDGRELVGVGATSPADGAGDGR